MDNDSEWSRHVHPHGRFQQLADRVWHIEGSLPRSPMPRCMVVHKLDSGGLWIHNAVALDGERMAELEALGEPEVLVVPSGYHRADAAVYKARYPRMRVLTPAGARKRVAKAVDVDATAEEALSAIGVRFRLPDGVKPRELVYEIPTAGGCVLVVNDLLFNLGRLPSLKGWFVRAIGSSGFFGVTKIGRALLLSDRAAFRKWLEQQATRGDLVAIAVAHGDPITEDCAARLAEAAGRLA